MQPENIINESRIMLNPTKIKSVTMGIPWSAEVAVGEVEGYCDER